MQFLRFKAYESFMGVQGVKNAPPKAVVVTKL
jgi:hypothetical protein